MLWCLPTTETSYANFSGYSVSLNHVLVKLRTATPNLDAWSILTTSITCIAGFTGAQPAKWLNGDFITAASRSDDFNVHRGVQCV